MLQLSIDDQQLTAHRGQTVLEVARDAGIEIPTLCYHPDLSPAGSCRMCLVDVQGFDHPMAACKLPVVNGMSVRTETPRITELRRMTLALLLSHYVPDSNDNDSRNELLHWVRKYNVEVPPEWPAVGGTCPTVIRIR